MDWNGLIIFFNIIDHSMWLQGIVENFISAHLKVMRIDMSLQLMKMLCNQMKSSKNISCLIDDVFNYLTSILREDFALKRRKK